MKSYTSVLGYAATLVAMFSVFVTPLNAQWTNRYPKLAGYSHHVYLEGYELPTMNAGPTAPAVSPEGSRVAFSARGWIWMLDVNTGRAQRITKGPHMDFRPAWSPDGERLAFVRDDSEDTWIVMRDLNTGAEEEVNTSAIELDPVFGPDGALVYSSAYNGAFDLYSAGGATLTLRPGLEVAPSLSADGAVLVYLHKGGEDRIVARNRTTGVEHELAAERILSQTRPKVSPDGKLVVYNWPTEDGYELRVLAINNPTTSVRLTKGLRGLPLTPSWGPAGEWIWYVEADADEVMRLYKISVFGGQPEEIPVQAWDWGEAVGTLRVTTTVLGTESPAAARLNVVDGQGHPAVPTTSYAQFGLEDGRVFFYSSGILDVIVPAGEATVSAVQGLATPEVSRSVTVAPGGVTEVSLVLEPVWNAREAGYLSGDHHFHLNYGGPFSLDPEDLGPMLAGERVDVATPLLANLHNRFEDQHLWGWEQAGELPMVQFGQEVRSHFLGHLGLLNTKTLFWPWIWGPGYQVYGQDDRPNSVVLQHAQNEGGFGGYVHPISSRDPFEPANHGGVPIMLAVDGILGNMSWLEVACLWTDELGSAEMWYRFLNLGIPIVLEAGTDVMNNFYRTMPIGVTRLYVQTGDETSLDAYWDGFRAGRSFVTTGPMLEFEVGGAAPGGTVDGEAPTSFKLNLSSATPVESIEVLVNGDVVWSEAGLATAGSRTYTGSIDVPSGGWVAARARGGAPSWPVMGSYAFAQTGAVWIGHVGSVDPESARRAAQELLPILDAAEQRLRMVYGAAPADTILEAFQEARVKLARY